MLAGVADDENIAPSELCLKVKNNMIRGILIVQASELHLRRRRSILHRTTHLIDDREREREGGKERFAHVHAYGGA